MIPYYLLLGIPLLLSLILMGSHKPKKQVIILDAFFIIWLLLLFLRDESVGVDLKGYILTFENEKRLSLLSAFVNATNKNEYGFVFLTKIIADTFKTFRAVLIVDACISIIPIWIYYRKNVKSNAYLSISILMTLGLFSMSFSGLRQIIAVGCAIPCLYFTKKRKPLFFLLTVFIAFLFHRSSIVLLLMYPVYRMNFKWNKRLLWVVPGLFLAFVFRVPLFNLLYFFIEDYYSYSISLTNAYTILMLFIIFLVFSYIIPNNDKMDSDTIGLRNILILSVFLQIFSSINPLAMRMNYYYIIFIPVLMTKIISVSRKRYKQLAWIASIVMCVFFTVYYFVNAYTGADYVSIYPYIFMKW